jgi:predicted metal-dependent HD superfamily phosphohydrolase
MSRKTGWIWFPTNNKKSAVKIYNDLIIRYQEPHRFYHNFNHIEDCLREFATVQNLFSNPSPVYFAIWFHDAIYDPRAVNNEEKSAELATTTLGDYFSPSFCKTVADLILATKHNIVPTDFDTRLFVDIDLSILGQNESKFDQYEQDIRKEYYWVPNETFVDARSQVLSAFFNRNHIYSTELFQNRYEQRARHNIQRSLKNLQNRS